MYIGIPLFTGECTSREKMEAIFYSFPYMTRHLSQDTNQRCIATLLQYVVCVCVCVCVYSVCIYIYIYIYIYSVCLCVILTRFNHSFCTLPIKVTKRLATGWTVRGSNPVSGEIFCTCPERPRGPPSLLHNGYLVSFPGRKRLRSCLDHPPPSRAEVKQGVGLYFYTTSGTWWPVLGRTLP